MSGLGERLASICLAALVLAGCIDDNGKSSDGDPSDGAIIDASGAIDGSSEIDAGPADAEPVSDAVLAPDVEPAPDAAPVGPPCDAPEDCEPGAVCEGSFCSEPACRADGDCGNPLQACRLGECRDRCLGPNTCFRGGICIDGACMPPECADGDDCDDGELCRDDRCVEASPCEGPDDCDADSSCVEGNCEPLPGCVGDRQCAADEICEGGRCRPQVGCETREACGDNEDCVGGRCVPFVCRGDADCGDGEVCNAGLCLAPEAVDVATIEILTRPRTLVVGQGIALRAVALDLRGDIVATRGFTWEASEPEIIDIDAETGIAIAGPGTGAVTVRAGFGDADDRIWSEPVMLAVVELAEPAEGWRVRVIDRDTGAPVVGAVVDAGDLEGVADEAGIVTFDDLEAPATVSVYAEAYDYVTIVGAQAGALLVPLVPRSDDEMVAGFTGGIDFSQVSTAGEVQVGLAGGSFAEGMTQIDLASFIGELFTVNFSAGPIDVDIPVPGGMTLAAEVPIVGAISLKDEYFVTQAPGFRLGWSIAGRIDIGAVAGLFGGGGGFDVGRVLTIVIPFFERFEHGLRIAPDLVALPRRADEDDVDGDGDSAELLPDYDRFPSLEMEPDQTQALRIAVDVPELPDLGDGTEVALVFAGVDVDGVGFVPLGLSSASEGGRLAMRAAPPYGGLQIGEPAVLAMAGAFGGGNLLPRDVSVRIARHPDRLPADVTFVGDFMDLPAEFGWDAAFRELSGEPVDGVAMHRVEFRGGAGRWTIWFAAGAEPTVTLPFPPDGYPDLAAGDQVRFDAIELGPGADFRSLLSEGGPGDLADVDRFATGFSRRTQ